MLLMKMNAVLTLMDVTDLEKVEVEVEMVEVAKKEEDDYKNVEEEDVHTVEFEVVE